MKFKIAVLCILSCFILLNTNVYAREKSTYSALVSSDSEFVDKLHEGGLSRKRIRAFLDEMDKQADSLKVPEDRKTLEEYFLFILFNMVLADENFADVCGVFDIVFQNELIYIMENNMAIPYMFEECFLSVMYDAIKIEAPIEPAPPLEEIPPKVEEPKKEPVFLDLDDFHWAEKYIMALYEKGFMEGYTDKTFKPQNNITRAELAKLVCKAFLNEEYEKTKSNFSDINDSYWYSHYVKVCEYYGVFSRIYEDEFKGNTFVTRQEMCSIIYRAFLNSSYDITYHKTGEFLDADTLYSYAVEPVKKLAEAGVINGFSDYKFHPFKTTTRAEVCKVMALLLNI